MNACRLLVSPAGDLVAMVGGGGWRPEAPQAGGGYEIVFFRTKDLTSMAGKVTTDAYPHNCVFHPLLRLGAAYAQHSNRLIFFDAKSFVERGIVHLAKGPQPTRLMTFGDHGQKLYCADDSGIRYVPLELSAAELALLRNPRERTRASADDAGARGRPTYPLRTWTDTSGRYRIEARFGGVEDGKVILWKEDGARALVPLERLSDQDRAYAEKPQPKGG